jgi:hypothetical protein
VNWDPFQREVLAELGHVLYRQAGMAPPTVAGALSADAGGCDARDADAPGIGMASIDGPMLARLARAAGMSVAALQGRLVDVQLPAGLRDDPAAKRALWPRLRALRGQPG